MESLSKSIDLSAEVIFNRIYVIRGKKVMIDRDLAVLYEVETRFLNQAVRRNLERFPDDFMFQLNNQEFENWKSQIVISNNEKMGIRRAPLAFSEQGVAMLSGILNSRRAIIVNIAIMRAFVQLRQFLESNVELSRKVEELSKAVNVHDEQIQSIFEAIRQLIDRKEDPPVQRNPIGYRK